MRGGARVKDPAKLKNRKKKQLVLDQDLYEAVTMLSADEYNEAIRLGIRELTPLIKKSTKLSTIR